MGEGRGGRHTSWGGVSKKRCPRESCKKRARHLIGGEFLCRIHTRELEER